MVAGTSVGTRANLAKVGGAVDPALWPGVDPAALPEDRRRQFLSRKRAIDLYLAGASAEQLRVECGMSRSNVYRIIHQRCLAVHDDGTLMGWRGALPYLRLQDYRRVAPVVVRPSGGGAAGALQRLFSSPGGQELEQRFRAQIAGRRPALESTRRPKRALFNWFIRELRAAGHEARGEWPFNAEKMGYVSIGKFIDRVMAENPARQRALLGGPDAQRKARAGDGTRRPELKLFERVECDAHKLDARFVVMVPSPHGGHEPRKVHRLWVIVILEVVSRAVLGYHLSLRRECSAEDVLRAVKRALTRWTPRQLQFSTNAYVAEAGLPSHRHDRYVGACWNEFSVDGAMANICSRVERQLQDVVGAVVLKPQDPHAYASRRSKDDRPFIESFFRQLAEGGFHRLAATTGSSPPRKLGVDPAAAASATQFQLEYAEELLDTLIANYNATPHSGLGYRSPLAQLDFLSDKHPGRIRQADPGEARRMVGVRRLCTVLGGAGSGRRPHLNFANARYSAEWLCLRADLLGKSLWLHIEDEDDARWATVSTPQGLFLGAVRAAPPWHLTPHTLYIRQSIRALHMRRLLHLSGSCDAVEELIRYAEASADKKLPPHPAYLEARRVLQGHAEYLAGQSMVSRARPEASPPAATASGAPEAAAPGTAPPAAEPKPARPLPPMLMAKTW